MIKSDVKTQTLKYRAARRDIALWVPGEDERNVNEELLGERLSFRSEIWNRLQSETFWTSRKSVSCLFLFIRDYPEIFSPVIRCSRCVLVQHNRVSQEHLKDFWILRRCVLNKLKRLWWCLQPVRLWTNHCTTCGKQTQEQIVVSDV